MAPQGEKRPADVIGNAVHVSRQPWPRICPSVVEWIAAKIVAVELDQVKGIEEHAGVIMPVSDAIESRDTVITADNRLAVDEARTRAQPSERFHNQRKAPSQVIARS